MKTMNRLTVVLLLATVGALLLVPQAVAENKHRLDPSIQTTIVFEGKFHLVPPTASPEPGAFGTVTEENGFTTQSTNDPWPIINSGWWSYNSVSCKRLTPGRQYRILCVYELGGTGGNVYEYPSTSDEKGRLTASFYIGESPSWGGWVWFDCRVSVSSMKIVDEAGNVVLVGGP